MTYVVIGAADGSRAYTSTGYRFFETVDTGTSWNEVEVAGVGSFGLLYMSDLYYSIAGNTMYLYGDGGVCKSTDRGRTWWQAAGIGAGYSVATLGADEKDPKTVYVGTRGYGLYKSTNGGGSWSPINNTLPGQGNKLVVNTLTIDPSDSKRIYAGFEEHGLYQSDDGGETWKPIKIWSSQGAERYITAIALSRDAPGQIYLGTKGHGVWKLNGR
ncbi:MAG: hypothetical protein KKA73_01455 [Chloroflexi bacterium]|nr:hypothetical protein [Chloroflexota bacterium]MBU1746330.1 hypothetical protein [Chloroflexota bacterium]